MAETVRGERLSWKDVCREWANYWPRLCSTDLQAVKSVELAEDGGAETLQEWAAVQRGVVGGIAASRPGTLTPNALWGASPMLTHLCRGAEALRASPWAVLGVTLARVVAAIDPCVKLPAIIGGQASLNLGVILAGPSGIGKGAAIAASKGMLSIEGEPDWVPLGSGEGLSHVYRYRPRPTRQEPRPELQELRRSAIVTAGEIDTLYAQSGRRGSTLGPQLRQALSGEQLGAQYVDPEKRVIVDEHAYRMAFIVGAQPAHTGALLTGPEASSGTPQRMLWMPAVDTAMPEQRPLTPQRATWKAPTYGGMRGGIAVATEVWDEIDRRQVKVHQGSEEMDGLDGHAGLVRLKVAAALAALDGSLQVSLADWGLAALVMKVSNATRGHCLTILNEEHTRTIEQAGRDDGRRAMIAEKLRDDAMYKRIRTRIRVMVASPTTLADVMRRFKSTERDTARQVINDLVAEGVIAEEVGEYHGQERRSYRSASND